MSGARSLVVVVAVLLVSAGCLSPAGLEGATPPTGDDSMETATVADDLPGTPVPSTEPVVRATVVEVVDGDTVKIRYDNGTRDTVRLLGIDTPEVHAENTPGEFEGVPDTEQARQCLRQSGVRASNVVEDRLAGERVGLGFDENEGRRGYYDRLLAYVYLDGEQVNYRLVAEGHARVYDSEFVEGERYYAAEERAREAGRGLWTCTTATADGGQTTASDGGEAERTADATLDVSVHADAAGPDGDNLTDEYVTLTNTGDDALDVGGWTVSDEADHVYTVAEGTKIASGASLTVYTGSGSDTGTDRYWGRDSPVWNNDGDTVTVRDAEGVTVATRTYG